MASSRDRYVMTSNPVQQLPKHAPQTRVLRRGRSMSSNAYLGTGIPGKNLPHPTDV